MEERRRFHIALGIYAALAVLIWMTIGDIPLPVSKIHISSQLEFAVHITLRQLTFVILGLFVVRTVLHHVKNQLTEQ